MRAWGHIDHKLDMAFRSRAKQCVDLYKQVYRDLVPAQSQLVAWVLAVCPYRYLGRPVVLQHALVTFPDAEVRWHFRAGLSLIWEQVRPWRPCWEVSCCKTWGCEPRSRDLERMMGIAMCIENVPRYAPDDGRGDHMLVATDSWSHAESPCARSLLEVLNLYQNIRTKPTKIHIDLRSFTKIPHRFFTRIHS